MTHDSLADLNKLSPDLNKLNPDCFPPTVCHWSRGNVHRT